MLPIRLRRPHRIFAEAAQDGADPGTLMFFTPPVEEVSPRTAGASPISALSPRPRPVARFMQFRPRAAASAHDFPGETDMLPIPGIEIVD